MSFSLDHRLELIRGGVLGGSATGAMHRTDPRSAQRGT